MKRKIRDRHWRRERNRNIKRLRRRGVKPKSLSKRYGLVLSSIYRILAARGC